MTQTVIIPNGDRIRFPDDTPDEIIQSAIGREYPQYKPEPTFFQKSRQAASSLMPSEPASVVMGKPSQVSSGQIKNAQPFSANLPENTIGLNTGGINEVVNKTYSDAYSKKYDSNGNLIGEIPSEQPAVDLVDFQDTLKSSATPIADAEFAGTSALASRLESGVPSAPMNANQTVADFQLNKNPPSPLEISAAQQPPDVNQVLSGINTKRIMDSGVPEQLLNQAIVGFAKGYTGGLAEKMHVIPAGSDIPPDPNSLAQTSVSGLSQLAGFILNPVTRAAIGDGGAANALSALLGKRTILKIAADVVGMGIAGVGQSANEILDANNYEDAVKIVASAFGNYGAMGAVFSGVAAAVPELGLLPYAVRAEAINTAMYALGGTSPLDTSAQGVFNTGLNMWFARGRGAPPSGGKPTFSQKELREVLNGKTTPNAPQVAEGMNNGTTNVPVLPEIPASGNDQISGIPGRSGTDGVSGHADVLGEQRNGGTGVGNKIPANPVAPAETRRTPSDAQGENTALTVERRHDEIMRKQVEHMTPEELRHTILNDNLTGIPNRRAYAESPKQPYQASIDVDGLKAVNDNIGHDAGDQLLKLVATALKGKTDSAFHISGDEFIVQGRDERSINATLAAVRRELKRAEINVTLPDGREATLKGIGFSFGVDKDLAKAEQKLQSDKTSRELKGLRAPRGELPNGLTFKNPENLNTSQESVQKPQESVPVKQTLRDSLVADAYPGRQYVELTPFEKKQIRVLVKAEPERQRLLGERNALPQFGAGKILQREPGQTGIAGGERGRMEQGQQGTETPAQVAQQPEIQKGGGGTQQVPGIKPHIESLLKRLIPASRPDKTGQRLNLRPAIERAKELMAGTRQMTQGELSWWNRTAKGFEGVDAPSGEAARAIAAIVKAGKSEPAPLDVQESSAYNHEPVKDILESRDQREAIVYQVALDRPDWKEPIDQLLQNGREGKRGGLVIGTAEENKNDFAERMAKLNGTDVATELRRFEAAMQFSMDVGEVETNGPISRNPPTKRERIDESNRTEYRPEPDEGFHRLTSEDLDRLGYTLIEPLQFSVKNEAGKDIMYSALTKTVEDSKLNKASPEQWLGTLKNAGVKPDEIKWTDTDTWLKEQKGSISKADLLNHVRENEVQVTETVLGGTGKNEKDLSIQYDRAEKDAATLMRKMGSDIPLTIGATTRANIPWWAYDEAQGIKEATEKLDALGLSKDVRNDVREYGKLRVELAQLDAQRMDAERESPRFGPDTHPDLTTPGGDKGTYRELILTLPEKADTAPIDYSKYSAELVGKNSWEVTKLENGFKSLVTGTTEHDAIARAVQHNPPPSKAFKSTHYPDQPNPVAHIRFDVRSEPAATPEQLADIGKRIAVAVTPKEHLNTLKESSLGNGAPEVAVRKGAVTQLEANQYSASRGFLNVPTEGATRKTLHIAEVQSDWGQKGKREGFTAHLTNAEEIRLTELRNQADALRGEMVNSAKNENDSTYDDAHGKRKVILEEINSLEKKRSGNVPSAPFVTNTSAWSMLAMKRMIQYAAENRYDKLSWDVGQTQADRYDLSKQIGRITAERYAHHADTGKQDITISVYDKNDKYLLAKHFDSPTDPKISDMVGKEMAQKISGVDYTATKNSLENTSHSWSGLDLKVGGEGMKGFYDNMLVNEVNKYVKKFGGVVRDGNVGEGSRGAIRKTGHGYEVYVYGERKVFSTEVGAKEYLDKFQARIPTHEVEITPAMKEAALAGQPMFSKSKTKTQGFYSPELGTAFVNSDSVTPKEASKIILHEMTHAADTNGRMTVLGEEVLRRLDKQGGIPIYNRVIDRMQKAGQEGNPREALNYLVEETLSEARRFGFSKFDSGFFGWLQRQGFGISKTIKGWLANIRAAMYEHGFKIQVKDLTIDDMLAVAVRGMKEVATGKREAAGSVQPEIVAGSEKEKPAMVNVGLDVAGGKKRTPDEVVKTIEDLGVQVLGKKVHVSDTEDTLVAELSRPLTKDELYKLSVANKQEAVPQKFADGSGIMAGPSAEKWGDYNGNYFLLPNGKRASTESRPGLVKVTGANFDGKVANGEEWKRLENTTDARLKSRKNFYVDEGQGVHPEAGLDKNTRHDVALNNLYNGGKNPLRLPVEPDLNAFESAVLDHGFDGYYVEGAMGRQGRAVLLGDAAKSKLQTSETAAKQTDTPEFKRSILRNAAERGGFDTSAVLYHGTTADFKTFKVSDKTAELGAGVYLDRNSDMANWHTRGEGGNIKQVYIKRGDLFDWTPLTKTGQQPDFNALAERLKEHNSAINTASSMTAPTDHLWKTWLNESNADLILQLREAYRRGTINTWLDRAGYVGAIDGNSQYPDQVVVFDRKNIRSINAKFNPSKAESANILMSKKVITGDTGRDRTPEQLAAFERVGREIEVPTLKDRIKRLWKDTSKGMAQNFADQFAPIEDLNHEAYRLMRQSKGGSGAFAVLLEGGQLKLVDGTYAFDASKKGGVIERLLTPLQGEGDDFFWWVAANRAERLAKEDREHLFTPADIVAMKSLADGKTAYKYTLQFGTKKGSTTNVRSEIYADSLHVFNEFNKNTLDLAEQSGLIDATSRSIWEHEFYVPFYRVADSDGMRGMNVKQGVVRQQAFKQLKGGTQKLNTDLLENTLLNWSHLLDASAKNRAAKAALEAAEQMGVAHEITAPEKNSVWFMDKGQKRHFAVDDPAVMVAISSLDYAGLRGPLMTLLGKPKHWMTTAVTASPYFKIRNLIRDSLQSIAVAKLSYNVPKNIKRGFGLTKKGSDEYNNLLASGGMIHFGTMLENRESDRVRALVEKGVDSGTILNNESKLKAFYKRTVEPAITAYNELGDRGEAINRASLYAQLVKQGIGHGEAALQARDLLDFSMQGSSTTIRFMTQTVPFLNARIQGLYKLGKAGKVDPVRMSAVVGTVALFSIANMLYYQNDEDWKKREDWDRENYWWFKIGGLAYRVPKPFEVGAIASLAEHGLELRTNDEMTGKRFATRLYKLLENNLSLNPIPQTVKPLLDVYSNTDNFTGRQIESDAMQKLEPPYRFNAGTSMLARGASTAGNAATANNFLSPIQIDHLIRGYFAWLGTFVVQAGDIIARPLTGQPVSPAIDAYKKASGGLVAKLDSAQNRYVTQMYEQAKEVEQAYGTYRSLKKKGGSEAAIYGEAHKEEISLYHGFEKSKSVMSKLNNQIHAVEQSRALSADEKRKRILSLQTQKGLVAKRMSVAATRPAR